MTTETLRHGRNILEHVSSTVNKVGAGIEGAGRISREFVRRFGVRAACFILLGAGLIFAPQMVLPSFDHEPPPVPPLPAELPPGDYLTTDGGGWEIPRGPGEARFPVYIPHFDKYVKTDRVGWIHVPPAPNGESYAPFTWFCLKACQVPPIPSPAPK